MSHQEYIVKVFDNRTEWYNKKEKLHRLDGPAIEYANGDKIWYQNGKNHRLDGPAIECANGDKAYYINGEKLDIVDFEIRVRAMQTDPYEGKIIDFDGKKYRLTPA